MHQTLFKNKITKISQKLSKILVYLVISFYLVTIDTLVAEDDMTMYSSVVKKIELPFLKNSYFIPQGIGSDGQKFVYVAYYWKNKERLGNKKVTTEWSKIAEIDTTTGKINRVFRLYYSNDNGNLSHLGGIEYFHSIKGKNYIFAPSAKSEINIFSIPSSSVNVTTQISSIKPISTFDTDVELGCMHISKVGSDSILWGMSANKSAQNLYGYKISATDPPGLSLKYKTVIPIGTPFVRVNGLACVSSINTKLTFYFGMQDTDRSEWRKLSFIRFGSNLNPLVNEGGANPPVNGILIDYFAKGGQDFATVGDEVWSASESGALLYQEIGWKNWPYLYSVKIR
jgi:hypothetical protein